MKHIYSIFLSAVSLLWMLSGCVEDPDMDTRLQKAKAPEVSETSMEGEAYASSITLKAQIMKENGLPVKNVGFVGVPKQERSRLKTCVTSDIQKLIK